MAYKKLNILFIFGGMSSENQVSRKSVVSILQEIDREKYNVICIGITLEGKWLLTEASFKEIEDGSWEKRADNRRVVLSPDAALGGIISSDGFMQKIDLVWPVLHGKNGEDGTIQGLCELAKIKYVGSNLASSACCMDKTLTKTIVKNIDVAQANSVTIFKKDFQSDESNVIISIESFFDKAYPLFIKPASAGSSVGVSKVECFNELAEALKIAFKEDKKVIVEAAIVGQEVEVAILGNENPIASAVGEILSASEWYDYQSKYDNADSKTLIPARINENTSEKIRTKALEIYKILECKTLARADFFVTNDNEIIFNEINTLPGFTNISMYPKLWEYCGFSYRDLIDRIISFAIE